MSHRLGDLSVSRETMDRLYAYEELVKKWQKTINLISKESVDQIWTRHFLDSAQLFHLDLGKPNLWVDLGSGAGFPGLVCAILFSDFQMPTKMVLLESDQRKAVFLRSVIRELGLSALVRSDRIESITDLKADIVSARALTDLTNLIALAKPCLATGARAFFHKGKAHNQEVAKARKTWSFDLKIHPSVSERESGILEIRNPRLAR